MNNKQKKGCIAIIANSAWNLLNFRQHLIRRLIAAGYRVVLVAPDGPERTELALAGAHFIALRNLERKGFNPLRDISLLRELVGIYRLEKVEFALHFTIKPIIYGSLAARLSGTKTINTLTGLGYTFLADQATNGLVRLLYRLALQKAESVLFHNEDDLVEFVGSGLVATDRTAIVPGSGLPLAHFPQAPYEEATPGRFLFVGRLLWDKGIREFVAAARIAQKNNPDLQFHVVGAPDPGNPASIDSGTLESWITEGVIQYHGQLKDVRPALRKASVVVLPSYREGCPRVLLEASATGRAVIGTDVPGVRQVIQNDVTGYLIPARQHETLAKYFLQDWPQDKLKRMGDVGRRLIEEQFNTQIVNTIYLAQLSQFSKLPDKCLTTSPTPPPSSTKVQPLALAPKSGTSATSCQAVNWAKAVT